MNYPRLPEHLLEEYPFLRSPKREEEPEPEPTTSRASDDAWELSYFEQCCQDMEQHPNLHIEYVMARNMSVEDGERWMARYKQRTKAVKQAEREAKIRRNLEEKEAAARQTTSTCRATTSRQKHSVQDDDEDYIPGTTRKRGPYKKRAAKEASFSPPAEKVGAKKRGRKSRDSEEPPTKKTPKIPKVVVTTKRQKSLQLKKELERVQKIAAVAPKKTRQSRNSNKGLLQAEVLAEVEVASENTMKPEVKIQKASTSKQSRNHSVPKRGHQKIKVIPAASDGPLDPVIQSVKLQKVDSLPDVVTAKSKKPDLLAAEPSTELKPDVVSEESEAEVQCEAKPMCDLQKPKSATTVVAEDVPEEDHSEAQSVPYESKVGVLAEIQTVPTMNLQKPKPLPGSVKVYSLETQTEPTMKFQKLENTSSSPENTPEVTREEEKDQKPGSLPSPSEVVSEVATENTKMNIQKLEVLVKDYAPEVTREKSTTVSQAKIEAVPKLPTESVFKVSTPVSQTLLTVIFQNLDEVVTEPETISTKVSNSLTALGVQPEVLSSTSEITSEEPMATMSLQSLRAPEASVQKSEPVPPRMLQKSDFSVSEPFAELEAVFSMAKESEPLSAPGVQPSTAPKAASPPASAPEVIRATSPVPPKVDQTLKSTSDKLKSATATEEVAALISTKTTAFQPKVVPMELTASEDVSIPTKRILQKVESSPGYCKTLDYVPLKVIHKPTSPSEACKPNGLSIAQPKALPPAPELTIEDSTSEVFNEDSNLEDVARMPSKMLQESKPLPEASKPLAVLKTRPEIAVAAPEANAPVPTNKQSRNILPTKPKNVIAQSKVLPGESAVMVVPSSSSSKMLEESKPLSDESKPMIHLQKLETASEVTLNGSSLLAAPGAQSELIAAASEATSPTRTHSADQEALPSTEPLQTSIPNDSETSSTTPEAVSPSIEFRPFRFKSLLAPGSDSEPSFSASETRKKKKKKRSHHHHHKSSRSSEDHPEQWSSEAPTIPKKRHRRESFVPSYTASLATTSMLQKHKDSSAVASAVPEGKPLTWEMLFKRSKATTTTEEESAPPASPPTPPPPPASEPSEAMPKRLTWQMLFDRAAPEPAPIVLKTESSAQEQQTSSDGKPVEPFPTSSEEAQRIARKQEKKERRRMKKEMKKQRESGSEMSEEQLEQARLEKEQRRQARKQRKKENAPDSPEHSPEPSPEPSSSHSKKSKTSKKSKKSKKSTEDNSDKATLNKKPVYICPECGKESRLGTCRCNGCNEWVHFRCARMTAKRYNHRYRCTSCSARSMDSTRSMGSMGSSSSASSSSASSTSWPF